MSKYFVGWALVSFETEKCKLIFNIFNILIEKEDIILQYK